MIIFLYGADSYRSTQKLKELKDKFVNKVDKDAVNLIEVDGERITLNDFNKAVATRSFLVSKRMIVVKNILKQAKKNQLDILAFLKKGAYRDRQKENIIVIWETEVDKRGVLFKYLAATKFSQEFNVLQGSALVNWIKQTITGLGLTISSADALLLAQRSDGNLWALSNEIKRLAAGSLNKTITSDDIKESYLVKTDNNIFNLTDAVGRGHRNLALKLIDDQLSTGESAIYILTMLLRQFSILTQLRAALNCGLGNYKEIAKKLDLHPFVVQKSLPQASQYTLEQLKIIYQRLLQTDIQLKRGLEPATVLETLLLDL